jgi:hypothetical protein
MDDDDILEQLGVDPARLEPAPPGLPAVLPPRERQDRYERPCAACGQPARTTRVIDLPGHGPRWLDRCRDCFLATVPRGSGQPAPLEETLAVLAEAAREAGVTLTVITDT